MRFFHKLAVLHRKKFSRKMVRPYRIKVNKRNERPEIYDHKEEDEQPNFEEKQNVEDNVMTEEAAAAAEDDTVEGIHIALTDLSTKKSGVVFVLEKASLEIAKVGKSYKLLNSDDHHDFLRRNNRNPADYRPDITHQALLMILDSPVNQAGRLNAVYVRTQKGVLIEVKPYCRIPRTFKRFTGLMEQLLQNPRISGNSEEPEKLLRCIKNPVRAHLPLNSRKIGFSHSSEKVVSMQKHLATVCNDTDTVFVLDAMSHGKIDCDYVDDFVSISGYPMSVPYCISRICEALSTNWNII